MQTKLHLSLFTFTLIWGVTLFWIAPHPPLTDLPQHAAQVTLLKDILLGQSQWATLFDINFFTPYLASYALAAALSLCMPVVMAFKILLSLGYLAFVLICVKLRQHFEADSRLDWLFILPFFGFAYQWGFISFILSAPIGLWFILLASHHAKNQTNWSGIKLFSAGFLLLESHGLMFLFAMGIGGLFLIIHGKSIKSFIASMLPYLVLAMVFTIIFFINLHLNSKLGLTEYTLKPDSQDSWWWELILKIPNELLSRLNQGLLYTLVQNKEGFIPVIHLPVIVILLAAPWLLGLRIGLKNISATIIFVATLCVFLFIPDYIFGTAYVYQRFSLFLIPGYAFLFTQNMGNTVAGNKTTLIEKTVMTLLPLACWVMLTFSSINAFNFHQESKALDETIARLEPNQKALALIFDYYSDASNHTNAYSNYVSWYQAEKHGLVDFNFAYFAPMVVRYKPEHLSSIPDELNPYDFDWVKHRGNDYHYFFVRSPAPNEIQVDVFKQIDLFKRAPCKPKIIASERRWTVYENRGCISSLR
jgi:hypothetical protein